MSLDHLDKEKETEVSHEINQPFKKLKFSSTVNADKKRAFNMPYPKGS